MSVYVDPLINWGAGAEAPKCFRNKPSCHMYADTLEELHKMAIAIGLKRAWFQDSLALQHYDLVTSKRRVAVLLGAIEHDKYQMVDFMRKKRKERIA